MRHDEGLFEIFRIMACAEWAVRISRMCALYALSSLRALKISSTSFGKEGLMAGGAETHRYCSVIISMAAAAL